METFGNKIWRSEVLQYPSGKKQKIKKYFGIGGIVKQEDADLNLFKKLIESEPEDREKICEELAKLDLFYDLNSVGDEFVGVSTLVHYELESKKINVGSVTKDKPKNVGKANQTTCFDQIKTRINRKIDNQRKKTQNIYKQMSSAVEYHDPDDIPDQEFIVQEKIDGLNCQMNPDGVFTNKHGSTNMKLTSNLIEESKTIKTKYPLVGELFIEGLFITKMAGIKNADNKQGYEFDFIIFDCISDEPVEKRLEYISQFKTKSIRAIEHKLMNKSEIKKFYKEVTDRSGEGLMLRIPGSKYEQGKKSKNIIKLKPRFEEEFEVIGFEEIQTGKKKGCSMLECTTTEKSALNSRRVKRHENCVNNNKTFKVTYPRNEDEAREFTRKVKSGEIDPVGMELVIHFDKYTEDWAPFQPVAHRLVEKDNK